MVGSAPEREGTAVFPGPLPELQLNALLGCAAEMTNQVSYVLFFIWKDLGSSALKLAPCIREALSEKRSKCAVRKRGQRLMDGDCRLGFAERSP